MARVPQKGFERNVLDSGAYLMQLIKIEDVTLPPFKEGDKERDCWRWTFVGHKSNDKEKTRRTFEYLTGTRLTAKDSNLKKILTLIFPEATLDFLSAFDVDTLIRKNFRLRLSKGENMKGEEGNSLIFIEDADDDDFDPFADD